MSSTDVVQTTPANLAHQTDSSRGNGAESPRDGNSHPSLTRAVTRMILREKTFVTQLKKAKLNDNFDSVIVKDKDESDEETNENDVAVDVIDEQHDDDVDFNFDDEEEEKQGIGCCYLYFCLS